MKRRIENVAHHKIWRNLADAFLVAKLTKAPIVMMIVLFIDTTRTIDNHSTGSGLENAGSAKPIPKLSF